MKDEDNSAMKKIVTIGTERVELFSLDGSIWATDLAQVERRQQQRAKETAKVINETKRYFQGKLRGPR